MRNYTITSVWGIPIRINVSLIVFLPVLAWIIGSGTQIETYVSLVAMFAPNPVDLAVLTAGSTPWVIGVSAAVGLFVSVALHELGHAWAARRYGIGTKTITLWLLGGIADLESIPREWDREFWIAIAGPITSVLIAGACFAVVQVLPAATPVAAFVFGWLVVMNVVLTVFNLLPAFPMDGGRIFRAVLARSRSYESATRSATRLGAAFAVLFAIVGVLNVAPMLLLLSVFLYGAASSESRIMAFEGALAGLTLSDIATADVTPVQADASVSELWDRMLRDHRTTYPVADGESVVGVVTLEALREANVSESDGTTINSIMVTDVPQLSGDLGAFEGYLQLSEHSAGVGLVQLEGSAVGVVTLGDFTAVISFRKEVGSAGSAVAQ